MSIMFRSAAFSFNSMRSNSARLFRRSSLRGSIAAPVRRTFSTKSFGDTLLKNGRLNAKNFPPAGKQCHLGALPSAEVAKINAKVLSRVLKKQRFRRKEGALPSAEEAKINAKIAAIDAKTAEHAEKMEKIDAKIDAKMEKIKAVNAANAAKAKYMAKVVVKVVVQVAEITFLCAFGSALAMFLGAGLQG